MESPHLRVKKRQRGWNKEKAQPPPPPLPLKAPKSEGCGEGMVGETGVGAENTGRGFRQYPLLIRPARDVEWITRVHSQQLSSSNRSIVQQKGGRYHFSAREHVLVLGGGEALGTGVQQPGTGDISLSSVFGEIQTITLNGHTCCGQHTDWHLLCNTPRGRAEIQFLLFS